MSVQVFFKKLYVYAKNRFTLGNWAGLITEVINTDKGMLLYLAA